MGSQTLNGKTFRLYKSTNNTIDKTETVLVGEGIKTSSGNTSHEVIYNTSQEHDLRNLLAQAKQSNLNLIFQGTNISSDIYRFDNSFFTASVSLAFDKKSGNVDVWQK
jgi:hypothetical protein